MEMADNKPTSIHSQGSEEEEASVQRIFELQQRFARILEADDPLSARCKILDIGQELLKLLPAGHPRRHEFLESLANALYDDFENRNEWDALETAIEYLGEVIADTDGDDNAAAARLDYAYSRCLRSRFMRGQNKQDLENAIACAENSVERTGRISEGDVMVLADRKSNLWFCLFTKADYIDGCPPEVLDRAIAIAEEVFCALKEASIGGHLWIEAVSNLGLSLQVRWDKRHCFNDLERSIELGYQVCSLLPTGTGLDAWVEGLSNLAFRLQRAFKCFLEGGVSPENPLLPRGERLQEEALKIIAKSMDIRSNRMLSKLSNVFIFVGYIRELPAEARGPMLARVYPLLKDCIGLLQDITLISLRDDQRNNIKTFYGLSRYAAAAAIEAGASSFEALRLLEEGRGIAMSIQLDSNRDAADLKITDPALERRYTEARDALTGSVTRGEPFYERHENLRRLREVQLEIRKQPEQVDFDRALGEVATKKLADEGVIVVVNVTDLRCDAIIIVPTAIDTIPLPGLNEDKLVEDSEVIQTYLAKEEGQYEVFFDLWERLSVFLKLLWTALAKPVLDHLGYEPRKSNWPHVWWVPTGILSLYPIHAAGIGLHKKGNVMNRVISSYTPTLKALAQARSKYVRQSRKRAPGSDPTLQPNNDSTVAIVTMHKTPSHADLEYSEQEAAVVQSYFPSAKRLHERTGKEVLAALQGKRLHKPTGEAVLETLQVEEAPEEAPSIVHFSCHGDVDYGDPSQSILLMTDWETHPLTVGKLQRLNIQSSQLAFLSACFTANAGVEDLQDEMEHLACAMQVAGFTSVVGSLWSVEQGAAYAVVKEFYKHLAEGGEGFDAKRVAKALHLAVRTFGKSTCISANDMKGNPVLWAPFVHFSV